MRHHSFVALKILPFLILILAPRLAFGQSLDCAKFKNGTFRYLGMPNKLSIWEGNVQKSYSDDELIAVWDVRWLDECSIELTCKKVLAKGLNISKGDRVYAEITSIDENCFETMVFLFEGNQRQAIGKGGTMCLVEK